MKATFEDDPETDCTKVTIWIPRNAMRNAGPPPRYGEVSNVGIAADHDLDAGWESSVELSPEGMAMQLMRCAWYCAIDEVGHGAWQAERETA